MPSTRNERRRLDLTNLEHAVLEAILAEDTVLARGLRGQLAGITVVSRQHTGVGFFTYLAVAADAMPLDPPESTAFGDVSATIPGLVDGAGFVVFVEAGRLTMLEGYCYQEAWPTEITAFELQRGPVAG